MDILFRNKRLQETCNNPKELKRMYGKTMAEKTSQRLDELKAATTLEDIWLLHTPRCHELTNNRKGQLAIDLIHPKRLIFIPADPIPARKTDGGIDWKNVRVIEIIEIEDYHNE